MEIGKLPQIILLLVVVGILLGTGLLMLDKFGYAAKNVITVTNEATNYTGANISINHADVRSVTAHNITSADEIPTSYYTTNLPLESSGSLNFTAAQYVGYQNQKINLTYTYGTDSKATDVLQSSTDSIGSLATDWLPIIVLVIAVSIILFLVIRSFSGGVGRGRK